jgi:uncharacterized protein (TIGR03437 family)
VYIGSAPAPLLYVSPGQINFLVPPELPPGPVDLRVALATRSGPAVQLVLAASSPALFQSDPEFAVAVWREDVVTVYATGLGSTVPAAVGGELARGPAPLEKLSSLRVEIAGTELPPEAVLYAGAAPGFAGLYQIDMRMPKGAEPDPEIRISVSGNRSPAGVRLRTPK